MKIYTKAGDNGKSFAPVCGKVAKSALPFEVLGTLDEFNAQLGVVLKTYGTVYIIKIQHLLLEIGAQLATKNDRRLRESDIANLEKEIDEIDSLLKPLNDFILPSLAPEIHLARAICRRLERRLVEWQESLSSGVEGIHRFHLLIPFVNRLSDYLFVLARQKATWDDIWLPRKPEQTVEESSGE